MAEPDPIQSAYGRAGALKRWALTDDRRAATEAMREGRLRRFEQQVDPEGRLSGDERRARALELRRADMLRLAARSAAVRKARKKAAA